LICPFCEFDNIAGDDFCSFCEQDLGGLDLPAAASRMQEKLSEASVGRLGPRTPVTVAPTATIREVIEKLCEHHIGCVLVGDDQEIRGIFSERDALMKVAHRLPEVADDPVSIHMTAAPEQLDVASPIAFAMNRMSDGDFRHLPIQRDGRTEGIVSLRDVLAFLSEWYPDLIAGQP